MPSASSPTDVRIVPLDPAFHDRARFTCGRPALDRYIRTQAGQDMRKKANAVFVMEPTEEPGVIAGFYTLCGVGIDPGAVPDDVSKRLPHDPQVSATLLGQLAVATRFQGRGLGGVLLFDALARACRAADEVGSAMVVTDPLDDDAAELYRHYGFRRLEGVGRMFVVMSTIGRLVRGPSS